MSDEQERIEHVRRAVEWRKQEGETLSMAFREFSVCGADMEAVLAALDARDARIKELEADLVSLAAATNELCGEVSNLGTRFGITVPVRAPSDNRDSQ